VATENPTSVGFEGGDSIAADLDEGSDTMADAAEESVDSGGTAADSGSTEARQQEEETSPAPAQTTPSPAPRQRDPSRKIHVVRKGDNLCKISRRYYGSASKWRFLLEANRDKIDRPEDLRPKMKLVVPPADGPSVSSSSSSGTPTLSATTGATRYYDVKKRDTLWKISSRFYGKPTQWKTILKANRDMLSAAKDLRPGMRLVIPE
jgi:nucleoid-associated protein YgaU